MIGKIIRISDYKFTYGEETIYINVFGAFKDIKSGNKYIVYSYDNKKICYGCFFIKDNIGTVMISKDMDNEVIKNFVDDVLFDKKSNEYDIIDLNDINNIQIIDEKVYESPADINKLFDITIPRNSNEEMKEQPKKKIPLFVFTIILLFAALGLFLFINPEIITGKNVAYLCNKMYNHNKLPADIKEDRIITFNSKGKIISMDVNTDYIFMDIEYYKEFKNKSYFYKYIDEADTYKFDDANNTYRVFSNVDVDTDYFLPDTDRELITYFKSNGYDCKIKEE